MKKQFHDLTQDGQQLRRNVSAMLSVCAESFRAMGKHYDADILEDAIDRLAQEITAESDSIGTIINQDFFKNTWGVI